MAMTRPARCITPVIATTTREQVIAMATRTTPATTSAAKKGTVARRPTAPKDRQPKATARSEAKGKDVVFVYDDIEYSVPAERARDLELLEATEDGRLVTAVRGYIGPEKWNAFKEYNRNDDGVVDAGCMEGLLNELMRALGNS